MKQPKDVLEYIKFMEFKKNFNLDHFLLDNPKFHHVFEAIKTIKTVPFEYTKGDLDETMKMYAKVGSSFPLDEVAYFLTQHPNVPICDKPCRKYGDKTFG